MSRKFQSRYEKSSFYCCLKAFSDGNAYAWVVSCLIFALPSAFASKINISHYGRVLKEYSFKEVCFSLTGENSLLVESKGRGSLSCLGAIVPISRFCRMKQKEDEKLVTKAFSRSLIVEKKDKVLCEFLDSVRLSISCKAKLVEKDCLFPKKACELVKKRYANDLDLLYFTNPVGDELNCHFVQNKILDSYRF